MSSFSLLLNIIMSNEQAVYIEIYFTNSTSIVQTQAANKTVKILKIRTPIKKQKQNKTKQNKTHTLIIHR